MKASSHYLLPTITVLVLLQAISGCKKDPPSLSYQNPIGDYIPCDCLIDSFKYNVLNPNTATRLFYYDSKGKLERIDTRTQGKVFNSMRFTWQGDFLIRAKVNDSVYYQINRDEKGRKIVRYTYGDITQKWIMSQNRNGYDTIWRSPSRGYKTRIEVMFYKDGNMLSYHSFEDVNDNGFPDAEEGLDIIYHDYDNAPLAVCSEPSLTFPRNNRNNLVRKRIDHRVVDYEHYYDKNGRVIGFDYHGQKRLFFSSCN